MPALAYHLEDDEVEERLQDAIRLFGFKKLSPEQDQLIRASISGRDVFGILKTGGGKSACFQIPGVATRSWTLVVSPLIALQEDHVRMLRRHGIQAYALHSNLSDAQKQAVHYYFKTASHDVPSFLYLSPELLLTEAFHDRFGNVQFDRMAVDEAHCVSTWGDDFRPDYQRIRLAKKRLGIPICSAFDATVDAKIEKDIITRIPLRPGFLKVEASPMRPNLELSVRYPATTERAFESVLRFLLDDEWAGPTIIYCRTRGASATLYKRLRKGQIDNRLKDHGYSTHLFHALLPFEDKDEALRGFKYDSKPIVIATSAFGLGVDRADIRQVIHYQVPMSLIDYAQQIGRGGRDGKPARCVTLHRADDHFERKIAMAPHRTPTYDFVERIHGYVIRALQRRPPAERSSYDVRRFLIYMRMRVQASNQIRHKDSYENKVRSSIAMLRNVGIIREDGSGLTVLSITPGTREHAKLLALTAMRERMLVREQERLSVFFDNPNPDQDLLWEVLRWDDDLRAPANEE